MSYVKEFKLDKCYRDCNGSEIKVVEIIDMTVMSGKVFCCISGTDEPILVESSHSLSTQEWIEITEDEYNTHKNIYTLLNSVSDKPIEWDLDQIIFISEFLISVINTEDNNIEDFFEDTDDEVNIDTPPEFSNSGLVYNECDKDSQETTQKSHMSYDKFNLNHCKKQFQFEIGKYYRHFAGDGEDIAIIGEVETTLYGKTLAAESNRSYNLKLVGAGDSYTQNWVEISKEDWMKNFSKE